MVADEVKTLADEVNRSSDDIAAQVSTAQQAAADAVTAIKDIARVIEEMDGLAAGVAVAVAAQGTPRASDGLSQMAEALRSEIHRFVEA